MTAPNRIKAVLTLAIMSMVLLTLTAFAGIPDNLPDPDTIDPDTTRPVKVFILSGQSNMVGMGKIAGTEPGTLETITGAGMFPWLVDASNNWTVRNDVMYRGLISAFGDGPMTPGVMGSTFGPELGFGHVMGYYYDEPVIVIKSSIGNRSISWDYAPPSTERFDYDGKTYAAYGESPNNWPTGETPSPIYWYAGKQWDDCFVDEDDIGTKMTWENGKYFYRDKIQVRHNGVIYACKGEHTADPNTEPGIGAQYSDYWNIYSITNVTDVLDNFATEYPEYAAQGFEIAGFGWWQGHKDGGDNGSGTAGINAVRYELNMTNFINDLRAYYENRYPANCVADAPFVVATVGFNGGDWEVGSSAHTIHAAQMAVGDPAQHPEFADNVASVDTTGYWRDSSVSPTTAGYHYNGNAETFYRVGDALGRAMADLLTPYDVDAGEDMVTWSGESIDLDAVVESGITVTGYHWSVINPDPNVIVEFSPGIPSDPNTSNVEDPTVTITKLIPGDAVEVVLRLKVEDGVNSPVKDSIRINVYDDACLASIGEGIGQGYPGDFDQNCVVDFRDTAILALKWLSDSGLKQAVPKP